jgi:hypothetical protein
MEQRRARRAHGRPLWLVLGFALAFQGRFARADPVVRVPSESDDAFIVRVLGPSPRLAQKVVRSTELAGGRPTLIGFVNAKDSTLVGHLLIEMSPGHYEHVTFPSCDEEGGAPRLLAVFFARTAKEGGRDLAVLCKWDDEHAVVNGTSYSALFYQVSEKGSKISVQPLTDLNKQFDTDDEVRLNKNGKWVPGPKPKFTTVAGVKKLLTKMGLKQ